MVIIPERKGESIDCPSLFLGFQLDEKAALLSKLSNRGVDHLELEVAVPLLGWAKLQQLTKLGDADPVEPRASELLQQLKQPDGVR